jgi:hypothetical protein
MGCRRWDSMVAAYASDTWTKRDPITHPKHDGQFDSPARNQLVTLANPILRCHQVSAVPVIRKFSIYLQRHGKIQIFTDPKLGVYRRQAASQASALSDTAKFHRGHPNRLSHNDGLVSRKGDEPGRRAAGGERRVSESIFSDVLGNRVVPIERSDTCMAAQSPALFAPYFMRWRSSHD